MEKEFVKRHHYRDRLYIGSGIYSVSEYWLNDEGTERIVVSASIYYETFDENGKLIESVEIFSFKDQYKEH